MTPHLKPACRALAATIGVMLAGSALAQSPAPDVAEKVNNRAAAAPDFGPLPMMPVQQALAPAPAPKRVVAVPPKRIGDGPLPLVTVPVEAVLQGTVVLASHPSAQANPQPPAVPVNLSTGYIGAPLIESRG